MTRRLFLAETAAVAAAQKNEPSDARGVTAPPARRLLEQSWPEPKVRSALIARDRWRPFPTADERAGWQALPAEDRAGLVAAGEGALSGEWPSLPATVFLEFARNGNRSDYERIRDRRRARLRDLVVAECVEGKGRFLDEAVNGVWLTCEETFWGVPAHLGLQKRGTGLPDVTEPVIDLFAAETGAQLAWTHYLLGARLGKVNRLVPDRIALEIERRILAPYRTRNDFWWMGLDADRPVNNWNPWINSNCLACMLLMDPDEARRAATVHKVVRSLDRFLDSYHDDGGCDEGPSYWGRAGGSLFDNLELLHSATGGRMSFYDLPLVQEIGRYIYRAHIYDDWYVNFADAPAKVHVDGDLVFRYGTRIRDSRMRELGAWAASRHGTAARGGTLERQLPALFNLAEVRSARGAQPLVRDVWLPGIQVMAARMKEGSPAGLYVAAQGGHNAESHNHNDVGNFIVYANGEPVLIDVGVETYTAKTFSSQRYDIWTMQSAYHNCPTINGVMQGPGRRYEARAVRYAANDTEVTFGLDLAAAYPAEAGVDRWARTIRFDRAGGGLEIRDEWQLRKSERVELTLMTAVVVDASVRGKLRVGDRAVIHYSDLLSPRVEEIAIKDARLKASWGERIYRVVLAADRVTRRGMSAIRVVAD